MRVYRAQDGDYSYLCNGLDSFPDSSITLPKPDYKVAEDPVFSENFYSFFKPVQNVVKGKVPTDFPENLSVHGFNIVFDFGNSGIMEFAGTAFGRVNRNSYGVITSYSIHYTKLYELI